MENQPKEMIAGSSAIIPAAANELRNIARSPEPAKDCLVWI